MHDTAPFPNSGALLGYSGARLSGDKRYEPLGPLGAQLRHERPQGDAAMDIGKTCTQPDKYFKTDPYKPEDIQMSCKSLVQIIR